MTSRQNLTLYIIKQLDDIYIDDIIQSGFLFEDEKGLQYKYTAEVTYILEKPVWVNSMFASRCQWHLKDNPGQVINITAEVSNEGMLINPRMKKVKEPT